jgi:hypothetical protein
MNKPDVMLWLDDHRGQYIPRDFASSFIDRDKHVSGVSLETWYVLDMGPDHADYWEEWSYVLDNAIVTDEHGVKYTLHQDGALWLIPEGMEYNETEDTFKWPDDMEGDDEPSLLQQIESLK